MFKILFFEWKSLRDFHNLCPHPEIGAHRRLYENASGIFIFYVVALKGIMLFFHRKSLPDTRLSGPDYWESVCAGQFTRPHELILLDTRKTRNRTIREKCCYGDSNPSRGRERPAWLAGLHYSSNCSNLWGIFVLKSVDICPSGTKYGLWRGFPPPRSTIFSTPRNRRNMTFRDNIGSMRPKPQKTWV